MQARIKDMGTYLQDVLLTITEIVGRSLLNSLVTAADWMFDQSIGRSM